MGPRSLGTFVLRPGNGFILFADVAGYTRLMDTHESATHPRLMALLSEVIKPAIERGSGQIVKNTGDGFLARFESVNGAIEAAERIIDAGDFSGLGSPGRVKEWLGP